MLSSDIFCYFTPDTVRTHVPIGVLNADTPIVGRASLTDATRAPLEDILFSPAVISLGVIEVTIETVYDTI